jgi:hypothetical protein
MQRRDYLQMRAEEQDLAFGIQRWDTCPLAELEGIQAALTSRLAAEERRLTTMYGANARIETEQQLHLDRSRRLLTYLRALRYLREHGISPDWPRGSA